ncbi:MAG: hypothetical protein ACXWFS_04575, partial [Thermoanaerobaculia bacterium]
SLLLALLPPARMTWILFTNGEDNLSNDYINRVPLVGSMLDGTCSLGKFVGEAWIGGAHSGLAIFPIYYLNARFFHWSVWFELGLGLALVGATLALLARVIRGHTRWLLLPLLSLLLFSTSRVTVFTFGECALQYGFSQLGVAIGAYALVQWRERPLALATALALGGILASWSWGGGVMAWPVFAIALLALRIRSFGAWTIFLGSSAAGLAQYVFFLFFQAPDPGATKAATLGPRPVLDLLGRSFVNGFGNNFRPDLVGEITGLAGLVAFVILLLIRQEPKRFAREPAFVLVAWSLLVALQIAMFRPEAAPWYASPMAFFWAGLALLLAGTSAPLRAFGIAAIALLTFRVQRTWEDKSFYLPSRSPASAACLREWRTAPAACRDYVFQWGNPPPSIERALERAAGVEKAGELSWLGLNVERWSLSVFGPRRTYLLQGDVPLGRVRLEPESAPSFFSDDGRTRRDIGDFRRLDLVLSSGGAVSWRVDLPPNLKSAQFLTRVHAAPGDEMLGRGARVSVTAEGSSVVLEERAFLPRETARPLSVDLSSLAGKRVTLRLAAEETHEGATPLVFVAPQVLMTLDPEQNRHAS